MGKWTARVTNNCLFVDDVETGRIVLQHNARPGMRPYIHPLRGVDGQACLTEDSPWHHPWQHGIQTGFHGVNDCDFWFDPGQNAKAVIGAIEPETPVILDEDPLTWAIDARWWDGDGAELLEERQVWSLTDGGRVLFLDMEWTVGAVPDVTIDQGTYGGFFIRMPFRPGCDAKVVNSEGQEEDATEQQPAAWVDLQMQVNRGDVRAGIALLDHPENPGHPTHWRVDGQRGINPAPCIPGEINLFVGESLTFNYRLVLHDGSLTSDDVQTYWEQYGE